MQTLYAECDENAFDYYYKIVRVSVNHSEFVQGSHLIDRSVHHTVCLFNYTYISIHVPFDRARKPRSLVEITRRFILMADRIDRKRKTRLKLDGDEQSHTIAL